MGENGTISVCSAATLLALSMGLMRQTFYQPVALWRGNEAIFSETGSCKEPHRQQVAGANCGSSSQASMRVSC